MSLIIKQMPPFKRVYKKLSIQHKDKVDTAIKDLIKDPDKGEPKKGDLSGFFVYKFKLFHEEMLLAYTYQNPVIILVALGTHENFYRDLKKIVN